MPARVQKWLKRRNWRRTFHVHFIAFEEFDLDAYLTGLSKTYRVEVAESSLPHERDINIRLRPKQLYAALRKLPKSVGVFYEQV